jgi:hypothetical protein
MMMAGAGSNHVVTAHCIESGGHLVLTLTYAPGFHELDVIQLIAKRFAHHVEQLAGNDVCSSW